jgi:hypothetical protein
MYKAIATLCLYAYLRPGETHFKQKNCNPKKDAKIEVKFC